MVSYVSNLVSKASWFHNFRGFKWVNSLFHVFLVSNVWWFHSFLGFKGFVVSRVS